MTSPRVWVYTPTLIDTLPVRPPGHRGGEWRPLPVWTSLIPAPWKGLVMGTIARGKTDTSPTGVPDGLQTERLQRKSLKPAS